jgi:DNA-binding NarL/FixJ family response regulator
MLEVAYEHPQVILLDLKMPAMNGIEVLSELRQRSYRGSVIVLTGGEDEALLRQTLELGAVEVMGKPVDLERLCLAVEVALVLSDETPPDHPQPGTKGI